jgi:tRNA (cytosine34-C5)-methyltransferase
MLNNLDSNNPPLVADLTESTRKQHESLSSGSCILHYKDEKMKLHIVGWRGNKTMRAYIDVNDSVHMLRLLDADISKYGEDN